ncbi:hypothetical protein ACTT2I_08715 [Stenotrophomonas sp. PUT21]|uniref:hypothetical protein n=1 Tax=Stenotrophomonas sp. PUT21 TaxID=3456954 RepID=UPI003FCC9C1D
MNWMDTEALVVVFFATPDNRIAIEEPTAAWGRISLGLWSRLSALGVEKGFELPALGASSLLLLDREECRVFRSQLQSLITEIDDLPGSPAHSALCRLVASIAYVDQNAGYMLQIGLHCA